MPYFHVFMKHRFADGSIISQYPGLRKRAVAAACDFSAAAVPDFVD